MADIYSHSYFNIATTFSASSAGRCFSKRKIFNLRTHYEYPMEKISIPCTDTNDADGSVVNVRVAHTSGHEFILDQLVTDRDIPTPLLERAWVFQERLLAPRTLHFGCSEMIWECNDSTKCECEQMPPKGTQATHLSLPQTSKSSSRSSQISVWQDPPTTLKMDFAGAQQTAPSLSSTSSSTAILKQWNRIVLSYASLSLTQVTDRTHALAGLASRIQPLLNCDYLAGLWRQGLYIQLGWAPAYLNEPGRRRVPAPMPTWSWMCIYAPAYNGCHMQYVTTGDWEPHPALTIHDADTFCHWDSANPFGSIVKAQLGLSAAVRVGEIVYRRVEGKWATWRESFVDFFPKSATKAPVVYNPRERAVLDCPQEDGVVEGMRVVVLFLKRGVWDGVRVELALLLKPVEGFSGKDAETMPVNGTSYTRIGIVQFESDSYGPAVSEGAEVRFVKVL